MTRKTSPRNPLPPATARALIEDKLGARYLTIETLAGEKVAQVRLTGGARKRGTWAEVYGHIAKNGYALRSGFRHLPGAGILASTLIPA